MRFAEALVPARLLRRYKRFLADVELVDGQTVTAHCANPGAMEGLADAGLTVWLSRSRDPKRKLAWSWELVELDRNTDDGPPVLVGINTARPNRLAEEAIAAGVIPELAGYTSIRREVAYGRASRVDLLLANNTGERCYVEVKNAHLMRRPGLAEFPDTRTERGTRHLGELARMVAEGHRAVMLFVVQRGDASTFAIAADKDADYARAFIAARRDGVEAVVRSCHLTLEGIDIGPSIKLLDKP
jgi:sugar fermentation stimulation protein A